MGPRTREKTRTRTRTRTKKSQSQSQSPLGRPEQAGPTGPTEAPRPHSPLLLQTLTDPLVDVQRARASRVPREGEESSSEHQFDFMMPTHTRARARYRTSTSTYRKAKSKEGLIVVTP